MGMIICDDYARRLLRHSRLSVRVIFDRGRIFFLPFDVRFQLNTTGVGLARSVVFGRRLTIRILKWEPPNHAL
jgi:hypothetical protein